VDPLERALASLVRRRHGRITVDEMCEHHGSSRQRLSRKFRDAAGLSPKLYARITRFQALVQRLLEHDVSEWAGVSTSVGYYDQSHMINDFRTFVGAAPTAFFRLPGSS
jgi:transcriptional regulator GlxA family with amidase domain